MTPKKWVGCKNFFKGVSLIVSVGLILGLCVSSSFAQDKVKLTWSEWWAQEWGEETIQWIISSFEKEHPNVEVERVSAPHAQYQDKLLTLCQAGDTPDVMGMEVTWLTSFDKLGVLENLDPVIAKAEEKFTSRHNPAWDVSWKGRSLMTYLYTMSYGVYYNRRMFEEKGIEPPTDWGELREVLRKFRDPEKHRWGIAVPLAMKSSPHFTLYIFWTRIIQAGGKMVNKEGLAAFNSDAGVRTLRYWGSLLAESLLYPGTTSGALSIGEKEFVELFSSEQTPMVLTGPFVKGKAVERNPAMKGNVALTPPFEDATGGYLITGSGVSLSSQSEHPELAWDFIKHLLGDKVASRMIKEKSLFWANTEKLKSPAIKEDPALRYLPEMISNPDSRSWSPLPQLGDLCDVLLKNAQEYFLGKKTPEAALDAAAEYWNRVIKEAR